MGLSTVLLGTGLVVASTGLGAVPVSATPTAPITVAFAANGGSGAMTSEIFTAGVAKALKANGFHRAGYTFAGWNLSPNGSGTAYANRQTVTMGAFTTLYAQWTKAS